MQPLTIALLALAFAAGALLGWLLRGERRERADTIRLSRLNAQLDSQREAIHRQRRQREALQRKADDAAHRQREADRRVATMREALDEQTALRRKLKRRLEKTEQRYAGERDARKKLSRQLRLLILRTSQSRAAAAGAGEPDDAPNGTAHGPSYPDTEIDVDETFDDGDDGADDDTGTFRGDADGDTGTFRDDPDDDTGTFRDDPGPAHGSAATVADATPLTVPATKPEDLRLVRGIGPAMARELAAWGVRTLTQLAELDERRVDALDRELRFPGRIRRERWVEQARALIGRE